MAINTQRVIVGGLAAGLVANILDYIGNGVILKNAYGDAMNALKPGLGATMMTGSTIAQFVVLDFVLGIVMVFTYAAIRPRFGPGGGTAIKAGLVVWAVGFCVWGFDTAMGIFPSSMWVLGGVESLVSTLAAAYVGGMIYKEEVTA